MKITKEFRFEASHNLSTNDKCDYGPCSNIHGHSYKMFVTVEESINPDTFMVINFKDLKKVVNEEIVDKIDHTHLNESFSKLYKENNFRLDILDKALLGEKVYTTCEVMSTFIKHILQGHLGCKVTIKLYETATSFCEV